MLIHAAGQSASNVSRDTFAIALAVSGEQELVNLRKRLRDKGVPHSPVFEPDDPWNNSLMAIGIAPGLRSVVGKEVRHIPLLR